MTTFERPTADLPWRARTSSIPVVVGKSGLGWGRGLNEVMLSGPQKKEGDDKAPAGLFALSSVFGYAVNAETRMPYIRASADLLCVDDPKSAHYNKLVDASKIAQPEWRSAEPMRRNDVRYKWGIVVDHNSAAPGRASLPGQGSCVFLHVWLSPQTATIGCTAMAERSILDLIRWLNPAAKPVLVQMPAPIYHRFREQWKLP